MSIKLKVDDNAKKQMTNFNIEAQVLARLTTERRAMMDSLAKEILTANGLDAKLYGMVFSPKDDKWEAILKPGVLSVPTPGTDINKIKTN